MTSDATTTPTAADTQINDGSIERFIRCTLSTLRTSMSSEQSDMSVKVEKQVKRSKSFSLLPGRKLAKRSNPSLVSVDRLLASDLVIHSRIQGVFTPCLPPELWLHILRYATSPDEDADGFCPYVYKRGVYASSASSSCSLATATSSTSDDADLHTPSHSFLTHLPAHTHLPERLGRYNARLKWKASLTRVCREFNAIAQEVLFEEVWISGGKDGRKIAERLGGGAEVGFGTWSVVTKGGVTRERDEKEGEMEKERWWKIMGRTKEPKAPARPLGHRRSHSSAHQHHTGENVNPGRFIRRLRIETPSMDKCSPHDLLLILQHCPLLQVFEDCRSVRRPMHPLVVTGSEVVPFDEDGNFVMPQARMVTPQDVSVSSTDLLSQAILSRPLKRLTWTNYAHDAGDFERGVRLYDELVGPILERVGKGLEVLELVSCAEGLGMGGERQHRSNLGVRSLGFGLSGGLLTQLEVITKGGPSTTSNPSELALPTLTLPSLISLKATLDNATFSVLSTWSMPELRNLSVISADFGYGAEGFRKFFEMHGAKIEQLELGHSSGEVEEFWVTEQHHHPMGAQVHSPNQQFRIPLDAWCPNLKEFICSADAEWNWQSPDWIAPHVLLPAHAGLEFIGVRGMERRLIGDADEAMRRMRFGHHPNQGSEENPYFMLLQQFGSLLRKDAFPSLRYVRDMSWESDVMRRTGRMGSARATPVGLENAGPPGPTSLASMIFSSSAPATRRALLNPKRMLSRTNLNARAVEEEAAVARAQGMKVLRYWMAVLEKCRERGVWLEDWRGVNVTMGDLRRAAAGII